MNNYLEYRYMVIMQIFPIGPASDPVPKLAPNPAPVPTLILALIHMELVDCHVCGMI